MKVKNLFYLVFISLVPTLLVFSCSNDNSNNKKKPQKEIEEESSENLSLEDLLDISSLSSQSSSGDQNRTSILNSGTLSSLIDLFTDFVAGTDNTTSSTTNNSTQTLSIVQKLESLFDSEEILDIEDISNLKASLKDGIISNTELESIKEFLSQHNIPTDADQLSVRERDNILNWIDNNKENIKERLATLHGVNLDLSLIENIAERLFN